MAVNKKLIAKNTVFMYIRMFVIMGVTFYTSRVVLDKLGVDDYGIFNSVAGIVGVLSFLNNTLANGTSRFITYELGDQNYCKLKQTFSTALITHLMLMLCLLFVLETIGLWFLNIKLVVPEVRMGAAQWVYQISLLTMCISIIQVPFTSEVIAHEDMNLYAYIGVFEAISKLGVVYLLSISSYDKMVLYAFLILVVQLSVFSVFFFFCKKRYPETSISFQFNTGIFRNMLGFSGWNIIANLSESLKLQGSNILINLFFKPSLVAAQAVSNHVSTALMNFMYQFTTALNPQIIKTYAAKEHKASQDLTLQATVFVFDLVLMVCLPLMLCIEPILGIWLIEVPEKTVYFLQIALAAQILGVFNCTFYTPMLASGKLKSNSLWGLYLGVGQFVVVFFLYKIGFGVLTLPFTILIVTTVFSFFIKPIILINEIGYSLKDILNCYADCFKVGIPSVLVSILLYYFIGHSNLNQHACIFILSGLTVVIFSLIFMKKGVRDRLIDMIKNKLLK